MLKSTSVHSMMTSEDEIIQLMRSERRSNERRIYECLRVYRTTLRAGETIHLLEQQCVRDVCVSVIVCKYKK